MKKIKRALQLLIDIAAQLELNEFDVIQAKELLDHHEFVLSFDTLITQMFEYEIEITPDIYHLIIYIGRYFKLSPNEYEYMQELIRSERVIPKSVAERLMDILSSLH